MATLAITGLYFLILVWAVSAYWRRRDPLLRHVVLIFASVATLFVLGVVRIVTGELPSVVAGIFAALLLGQPFLTLRLVSRLRPVPRWIMRVALTGWAVSAVPVVALPRPLPSLVVWPVVGIFFAVEITAAWLLATQARHRGGAARTRLRCAAIGTALFGVALIVAGGGAALTVASRSIAVVSAVMYVLAFLPPRWLRRAWSWGSAYAVTRQLLSAPVDETAARTWQRYCQGAREVLGADDVVVLLPAGADTVRPIASAESIPGGPAFPDSDLEPLLAGTVTFDALAAEERPPHLVSKLVEASRIRFVTAVPLPVADRRGALVLLNRYRTLFADDDVALLAELGVQAAALAERASVLAERQRLAVIVESSHDAIIGKTLDGVITSWNAGAEQLYGYRAADVVGRHASMLFPSDQQDTEARLLARIAQGEQIDQYEVQRRRADGVVITASLTLSPITDPNGGIVGVASISRDISELRRAETMFRGLLEAAPDAIIGVTQNGKITLINTQAERLFGYQRDELLGQCVDMLVPPPVRGDHAQRREHYFAHPEPRHLGAGSALCAVRKDGTEFPAEISLSALETDQGVIVSAAIRDVTERIHAQAERERLAAQAERDAAERRLQHTRRLESLGQLAGGVAHDFNNILAVIANYTELLIDTLAAAAPTPEDLTAARADLGQIYRATERATRLTKQLLAFGRREITQAEILCLNHVIGDVEQMLRRTLGEHIHLTTQLDPDLWPLYVDPGQIEQILVNLAVNARDAMPTGGTLSVDTTNTVMDDTDVEGSPLSAGRYVRLRVSDTGTGMPPHVVDRALEPFYTTKPQGAGTGLGLATVYGIATAAGGDVHLYSEPDIGTTVTILLPASDASSSSAPAGDASMDDEPPSASQPHETILLVEDEDALREVTERILSRAGYQVLTAEGGAEAIHIAQTHPSPIHLLLTDVIMPKMMGNEVATRIHDIRPQTPVLYMSGYAQPVLTEHGTLQPGVTIIEKPFTSRELLDRISTVLHHHHHTSH